MRTPEQTAILLAVLFERSGQPRARVSQKTLKLLGYRFKLRSAFVLAVTEAIAVYGITMIELDNGALGLVRTKSLEGAKAVTAKRLMDDILPALMHGNAIDFDELESELTPEEVFEPED